MSSVNISGPYSLKVSHIGYSPEERSGINLSIGEPQSDYCSPAVAI